MYIYVYTRLLFPKMSEGVETLKIRQNSPTDKPLFSKAEGLMNFC